MTKVTALPKIATEAPARIGPFTNAMPYESPVKVSGEAFEFQGTYNLSARHLGGGYMISHSVATRYSDDVPLSLDLAEIVASVVAKQLEAFEDRIVERVRGELRQEAEAIREIDPSAVRKAVKSYFAEHHGAALDAEDVATALALPIWPVIDAMDALSAEGGIEVVDA